MKARHVDPDDVRARLGGRCFICELLAAKGRPDVRRAYAQHARVVRLMTAPNERHNISRATRG